MKKVLMITYYFPPLGGAGSLRTVKFTKYLLKYGWLPLILTINEKKGGKRDELLLKDVPLNVRVHRTLSPELPGSLPWRIRNTIESLVFFPDSKMGWIPFALSSAKKIMKKEKIDLIYSSSAPYTTHIVGLLLKKAFNCRWVADFRDPWTENLFYKSFTRLHEMIGQTLEREVVKHANRIISSTESYKDQFVNKYPLEDPQKFITITNGYDSDDFIGLAERNSQRGFRIVYTGSFYQGQSPEKFLSALRSLLDENPNLNSEVEVIFVGNVYKPVARMCEQMRLGRVVRVCQPVGHNKCIEYLASADVLLLLLNPGLKGCFPTKIFEYIRSGKPIMGLVPEGEAQKLLDSSRTGIVVDPENVEAIKKCMLNLYEAKKTGKLTIDPHWEEIKKYERDNQVRTLCACFDQLLRRN